jgi:hypothetical protein
VRVEGGFRIYGDVDARRWRNPGDRDIERAAVARPVELVVEEN